MRKEGNSRRQTRTDDGLHDPWQSPRHRAGNIERTVTREVPEEDAGGNPKLDNTADAPASVVRRDFDAVYCDRAEENTLAGTGNTPPDEYHYKGGFLGLAVQASEAAYERAQSVDGAP